MQHQSQGLNNGPTAGLLAIDRVITTEEIDRHVAEGKRLQAEAISAILRGLFRRRPATTAESAVAQGA